MANCATGLVSYTPDPSLVTVAETPRLGSQNFVAFLKGLDFEDVSSNPTAAGQKVFAEYGIGLLAPAIAVIVLFIVWTCSLCCAKCTCAKWRFCKGDSLIGLIVFLTFCAASCLGWFIAIGANAEAQSGVVGSLDAFECALGAIDTTLISVESILTFANETGEKIQIAAESCVEVANILSNANVDIDIPDLNLSLAIDEFLEPVTGILDPFKAALDTFENDIQPIFNIVRDGMSAYNYFFVVFVIAVIVLLSIFALTTAVGVIRVLGRHDILERWTRLNCIALFFRKVSSGIIFVVGYILLLLFIVTIALISIFVVVGSDICVPSPTENIVEIAEAVLQAQSLLPANTNICTDPNYRIVCHYLQCVGENPIKNVTDELIQTVNSSALDVAQAVLTSAQDALSIIDDQINNVTDEIAGNSIECNGDTAFCNSVACETACGGITSPDECPPLNDLCLLNQTANEALVQADVCLQDVDAVIDQGVQLPNLLQGVVDNALCENITPLYQQLVEQQMCNNLINGLALTYIALVLATFSLMGAMFVFRLMDLRPFQEADGLPIATKLNTAPIPVDPKAHQLK